jgi:type I restriction enzyme S subunit
VGSTFSAINRLDIERLELPVPPVAEQEQLVKLLDEADELRKLRAQADRRTADLNPALFHEMFGESGRQAFDRIKLEQVAEVVSGVAKGRKFNGVRPIEVPYLRVANVQAGHLDLAEIKTIQALPQEVEGLALRKGDVLLTEGGDFDKLGRGAMLEHDLPNCIHQNHVFRVRVDQSKLDPVYFAKFLLTTESRGYFLGCAKRTTNLASINMTQLRALPVLLPPLQQQRNFATRVAEIRAMETEQAASRLRLDDLFQSMLHRAFNGELSTRIDSDDASVVVKAAHEEQNALPAKHSKGIMFRRAAFDCYVISKLEGDKNLGRTKIEKISHLAEYHCGVDLERNPIRDAAGPNDYPSRMKVENLARKQKWYFSKKDKVKVDYLPGSHISKSRHTAENFLGGRKPAVNALISLMRPLDTAACEIIATLYAAWNDFLLAGKTPTDDELITEVRHNWHPEKLRIPVAEWEKGLAWMREHQLTPRGVGRPTIRNKSV